MSILISVLLIGLSFLIGSIPTAYLMVKKKMDLDIRQVGSKNVGATNAARVLGNFWFVMISLIDACKGIVSCLLMMTFSAIAFDTPFYNTGLPVVLAGTAAILGHTFTPWLGFKGGKGVATTFGVFILLVPITTLVCVTVFALIVLSTKYVSLGSMAGAVILPVGVFFEKVPFAEYSNAKVFFLLSLALAAFIIIKHRANITRLLQGNENKFGQTSH